MLAQLRQLDPSASAEIGTPERKIIDTVAQALVDSQVDLTVLNGALDVSAKFGADLDRFLAIFGFARQHGVRATGVARFFRETASTLDIRIPAGTQVMAPSGAAEGQNRFYLTTVAGVLAAGDTSVDIPIRAVLPGATSNASVGEIQNIVADIGGIYQVTNTVEVSGGIGAESDDEFKTRFRNTLFRNLAGTEDQYLALAVSTAFTTKANIVGPISRYREYIHVPPKDNFTPYDVDDDYDGSNSGLLEGGNGVAGEYTTALSTNPYAKHIYPEVPHFVSNGEAGVGATYYRSDIDFVLNVKDNTADAITNKGDAYRFFNASAGTPLGINPLSADANFRPNVTFKNVYTGTKTQVEAIRPEDIVLLEYSYLSSSSRNDAERGVMNAVDVFIDGGNKTLGTTIIPAPGATPSTRFSNNPTSAYYWNNYRRMGHPNQPPVNGFFFLPLLKVPVLQVPSSITVTGYATWDNGTGSARRQATATYYEGVHYWLVNDISELGGTVRARDGLEWSILNKGLLSGNLLTNPTTWTGPLITEWETGTDDAVTLTVENYHYDSNIIDLQVALEGSKQVTTDVLAHKAQPRYFKFDVTVMYSTSYGDKAVIDSYIQDAVEAFLSRQYFGQAIQLSDILQVIHSVPGVDNVRWSDDIPGNEDLERVYETDIDGYPLLNVHIDKTQRGSTSLVEIQRLIIGGEPESGSFNLIYTKANGDARTISVNWNHPAAQLETDLNTILGNLTDGAVDVTGTGTPADPFLIAWTSTGPRGTFTVNQNRLRGGPTVFSHDFFLQDNELPFLPTGKVTAPVMGGAGNAQVIVPADAVAGLIIRSRAQNTWIRG